MSAQEKFMYTFKQIFEFWGAFWEVKRGVLRVKRPHCERNCSGQWGRVAAADPTYLHFYNI